MSLGWRKCFLCNGYGELTIMRSRINIFKSKNKKEPILEDKNIKCPLCKGKGQVAIKIPTFLNPWRKDNNAE